MFGGASGAALVDVRWCMFQPCRTVW